MQTDISTELAIFNALREQLAEQEQLNPDDPFVIDTIDGVTTLSEALVALVRSSRADEAKAEALDKWIDELSDRKSRFKERCAKKRAKIAWAMAESGMKKLEEPDFTCSIRNNPPGVTFTCEPHEAPEEFVTAKTTYSWNRTAIKEALDKGSLTFAHRTNGGQSISIRTK
jgi:hypothetical protein